MKGDVLHPTPRASGVTHRVDYPEYTRLVLSRMKLERLGRHRIRDEDTGEMYELFPFPPPRSPSPKSAPPVRKPQA